MNLASTPALALLATVSVVSAGLSGPARAQMVYTPGDIILGFQATGGDGSSNT